MKDMDDEKELRYLPMDQLRVLFEQRKAALIAVRDEIDRRERDERKGIDFDFCKYVTD